MAVRRIRYWQVVEDRQWAFIDVPEELSPDEVSQYIRDNRLDVLRPVSFIPEHDYSVTEEWWEDEDTGGGRGTTRMERTG